MSYRPKGWTNEDEQRTASAAKAAYDKAKAKGSLRPLHCYYCQTPVTDEEHRVVFGLMTFLMEEDDPMNPMFVDVFVHMTGALPTNLDDEGEVVVCSKDAVRELFEGMRSSD